MNGVEKFGNVFCCFLRSKRHDFSKANKWDIEYLRSMSNGKMENTPEAGQCEETALVDQIEEKKYRPGEDKCLVV